MNETLRGHDASGIRRPLFKQRRHRSGGTAQTTPLYARVTPDVLSYAARGPTAEAACHAHRLAGTQSLAHQGEWITDEKQLLKTDF
jgi:hypothetical protein